MDGSELKRTNYEWFAFDGLEEANF